MKVTGTTTVSAPVGVVWAALQDRDILARAIPGCERFEVTDDGRCQFTLTTAIAAIRGTYTGDVVITEADAPGSVSMRVSAASAQGAVSADVVVSLSPAGDAGTRLSYEAEAKADGPLAGIGQRMLASIAGRLGGDFLGTLSALLAAPQNGSVRPATMRDAASAAKPDEPAIKPAEAEQETGDTGEVRPRLRRSDRGDPDDRGIGAGIKTGLLAGGAVGLVAIAIGIVFGRRQRPDRGGR